MIYRKEYLDLFDFIKLENKKLIETNYEKNIKKIKQNILNFENGSNMLIEELLYLKEKKIDEYKRKKNNLKKSNFILKIINKIQIFEDIIKIKELSNDIRYIKKIHEKNIKELDC